MNGLRKKKYFFLENASVCLLQNHSGMQDFNVRSMIYDRYPCKYDIKSKFVTIATRMLSYIFETYQ